MRILTPLHKMIFTSFLLLLLLISVFGYITNKNVKNTPTEVKTTPTNSPIPLPTEAINPSYQGTPIPTYTPDKGRGVDIEAPLVANSLQEIKKLEPFLPYEQTLSLEAGQEVYISIPDKTLQPNPWTLTVYIIGFDYHLVKTDPQYASAKKLFVGAATSITQWIQSKGVDPKKIMIIWGDTGLIQNKSQEWLE